LGNFFKKLRLFMRKKLLIIIPVLIAVVAFAGYRFLYKAHRDISSEDVEFTLTVNSLQKEFMENDSLANAKYADKTIVISGKITAVDAESHSITVDEKLSATMKDKADVNVAPQSKVRIKGRFVGYDDLLEELKMDQVSIIN
jgi:glutaredoxin-related protein